MFEWIKNLMAVPVSASHEAVEDKPQKEDIFETSISYARGAFALPADYFDRVVGGQPPPSIGLEAVSVRDSVHQSPLYRLMNAVHPSVPQEIRNRLWTNSEFRNVVAHVFHNVSDEAVLSGMEKLDDGYNAVFKSLLSRVLSERLVGLPRHSGPEGWVYEA